MNKFEINKIIENFAKNQILVLIGFEFEFYIIKKNNNEYSYIENIFENDINKKNKFMTEVQKLLDKANFLFQAEDDESQFEISSNPSCDPCSIFELMKNKLIEINNYIKIFFSNNSYEINYLSKPFLNKPSNGMHFHLSLHKIPSMENIFGIQDENSLFLKKYLKNDYIGKIISVLLFNFETNVKKFFYNDSLISRIKNYDMNTPINISWGKNNRSTLIRIPDALSHAKTIEFRIPSPENDFYESLFFLLNSSYEAIFNFEHFLNINFLKNPPLCLIDPVFGIASNPQYKLKKIIDLL